MAHQVEAGMSYPVLYLYPINNRFYMWKETETFKDTKMTGYKYPWIANSSNLNFSRSFVGSIIQNGVHRGAHVWIVFTLLQFY